MTAARPQGMPPAPTARERRRAAALAAAEHAITTATLEQLETIADRLQALALAERRLRAMRNDPGAISGFAQCRDLAP